VWRERERFKTTNLEGVPVECRRRVATEKNHSVRTMLLGAGVIKRDATGKGGDGSEQ